MGTIADLNELTAPAVGDYFVVRDISDVLDKDKKMTLGKVGLLSLPNTWTANNIFTGNVGIGSSAPLRALHVGNGTTAAVSPTYEGIYVHPNGPVAVVSARNNTGVEGGFYAHTAGSVYMGSFTNSPLTLRTNNLDRLTIDTAGKVTIPGGIAFAHETLAYYDEGLWTPVVADAATGGNVATIAVNDGWYVRIGSLVLVTARIANITTSGMTGANNVHIRGLPFAASALTNYEAQGMVNVSNVTFSGYVIARIVANTSYVTFMENVSAGNRATITVSDLTSTTAGIFFTMLYSVQ